MVMVRTKWEGLCYWDLELDIIGEDAEKLAEHDSDCIDSVFL